MTAAERAAVHIYTAPESGDPERDALAEKYAYWKVNRMLRREEEITPEVQAYVIILTEALRKLNSDEPVDLSESVHSPDGAELPKHEVATRELYRGIAHVFEDEQVTRDGMITFDAFSSSAINDVYAKQHMEAMVRASKQNKKDGTVIKMTTPHWGFVSEYYTGQMSNFEEYIVFPGERFKVITYTKSSGVNDYNYLELETYVDVLEKQKSLGS